MTTNRNPLAVMDKTIDSVNMRMSPEHAAWNAELREARAAVVDLYRALRDLHSCHRAFSGNENWTTLDDAARSAAEAALARFEEK